MNDQISNDKLLEILSSNNLGTILVVYEREGKGPEKIISHIFAHGLEKVRDVPGTFRAIADRWEEQIGKK